MMKNVNDLKHSKIKCCYSPARGLCDLSCCSDVVPFRGDFSAVDDFGGCGHGADVSHPAAPSTSKRGGREGRESASTHLCHLTKRAVT